MAATVLMLGGLALASPVPQPSERAMCYTHRYLPKRPTFMSNWPNASDIGAGDYQFIFMRAEYVYSVMVASKQPVFALFYQPHCALSRLIWPTVVAIAYRFPHVLFIAIDVAKEWTMIAQGYTGSTPNIVIYTPTPAGSRTLSLLPSLEKMMGPTLQPRLAAFIETWTGHLAEPARRTSLSDAEYERRAGEVFARASGGLGGLVRSLRAALSRRARRRAARARASPTHADARAGDDDPTAWLDAHSDNVHSSLWMAAGLRRNSYTRIPGQEQPDWLLLGSLAVTAGWLVQLLVHGLAWAREQMLRARAGSAHQHVHEHDEHHPRRRQHQSS